MGLLSDTFLIGFAAGCVAMGALGAAVLWWAVRPCWPRGGQQ